MAKERWVSGLEAAEIMSKNSGHTVSADYIRLLSNKGKIGARDKNKREKEYSYADVSQYHVREKQSTKKEERV